jgi:DNA-binding Lrp family transcriptional regulator
VSRDSGGHSDPDRSRQGGRGGLPGVLEAASVAGPYDVIARAQARDIDELAKLAASRVQALDGVTRTISCPVIHL